MDEQELQARLRAADPARGPGPPTSWIDDLVGATMDDGDEHTSSRAGGARGCWWPPRRPVAAIGGGGRSR